MFLVILVWLFTVIVLARLCLKGRHVGDDPHCTACNFNLVGIATEPVTPEDRLNTGVPQWTADPTNEILTCTDCGKIHRHPGRLPLGERRSRPRMFATLALLVLTPVLGVLMLGQRSGWTFSLVKAAPHSLLAYWVIEGDYQLSGEAATELKQRFGLNEVSDSRVRDVAIGALERLESYYTLDPSRRHEYNFGDGSRLIFAIHHATKRGLLSNEERQRVLRVGLGVIMTPVAQARPGAALRPMFWQRNGGSLYPPKLSGLNTTVGGMDWFPISILEVRADGEPLAWTTPSSTAKTPGWECPVSGRWEYFFRPDISHPLVELEPGEYTLEWDLQIGPFSPVSDLVTLEDFEAEGLEPNSWILTVTSSLEVLPDEEFDPPSLIHGLGEWDLLRGDIRQSYSEDLEIFIEDPGRVGLRKNQFVPYEVILASQGEEYLLFYAACHDIDLGHTMSGRVFVEYSGETQALLERDPEAVIILRSTREAAMRQYLPLSLRVPDRELVYQYDEQGRIQRIGEGLPNPLAIELGLIDAAGEPVPGASAKDGP